MSNKDIYQIIIPAGVVLLLLFAYYLTSNQKYQRLERRINRVTRRRNTPQQKSVDTKSLRKAKEKGLPVIGKLLQNITTTSALRGRLERAGLKNRAGWCIWRLLGVLSC